MSKITHINSIRESPDSSSGLSWSVEESVRNCCLERT
ncbi:hypothetical protein Ab1vBOLIVR5_gp178 [Agrobacterium phage OLIVR5]|uniref:Uncharacterized protein n=1 Tax=Agrobacterium phage OLIVR5 TaxID=2723773 RepID=A0A858MSY1_9CAUD|nr:hypothetical protein KNU99_gp223 [Agrobacterium phage OLIVR5]QIW87826.1 hypothetical protein Ab1vBOLIVR5_gp178 [Agrobacterium phage OLIVR5]QIW88091.1 hypothetical protein Ab1vBOLIVR6_gp184 [Agrobacterium phage OLIVR6]